MTTARTGGRSRAIARAGLAMGLAAALGGAGCGSSDGGGTALVRSFDSSWIRGQASLATSPEFLEIAARAQEVAARRLAERKRELALLEAARIAAKKREKAERLRAYLEAKRRAEAAYRVALRKAAAARRRQLALLAKARADRARKLRELAAKLRVAPGEECSDPQVRKRVRCQPGRLPTKPAKK